MEETLGQQASDLVKVVLFGPESTGKTTLAARLAEHYQTLWVPEYAREYLQEKWDRTGKTCENHDLIPIARGQIRLENEAATRAERLLICDTDLLETKVYSETYYGGFCDPLLEEYALKNTYDLYFLTDIDVPWEADDLRDRPHQREEMFAYFKGALEHANRRFVILRGSLEQRLEKAISHIDNLLIMHEFSPEDLEFMKTQGYSPEKAAKQIEIFREGIPPVKLSKAAVVGDGILRLSQERQEALLTRFRNQRDALKVVKFTPASGAASRMFKALFGFLDSFNPGKDSLEAYLKQPEHADIKTFYDGLEDFPFYEQVRAMRSQDPSDPGAFLHAFVSELLSESGMNYGFYPKGLLAFHRYGKNLATPFEEHLYEGAAYAQAKGTAHLHFTISPQHEALFREEYQRAGQSVSQATSCRFEVGFSFQKPATDTLAVTPENEPFRDENGQLLFRPGGHGALIENLDEQDADVLFIKNIDNVVVRTAQEDVARWKEILGGLLLELQEEAFRYARMLEEGSLDLDLLMRIRDFLRDRLNVRFPESYHRLSPDDQVAVLKDKLNRPLRVCGMVRNEGEPGGGPFWIQDVSGNESLQIVESAQVDLQDASQQELFKDSTHFNPVDLVCGVRDAYGKKYLLQHFVDERQGFITGKTYEGRPLKALELPGLWNGGMAFWNTVFAEVPVSTFNPVKTVNDLLKPAHKGKGGE
ncbi:DUF4301 family protein [Robiginitalea sp. M366]|uniref:DUF4301 family protein n=1 Tax=Robiginitalea aestuariiviva TaxID=3036903 RepID=UPI00240CEEBA|nr:DUF4301 family protein [Robiginitalea aestuariiviva]MDG1571728.1 DUF4301 family protein [Robiginitalea aestuariiviva]